ncbi:MAG: DUF1735 domain-containing protein [Bacteroidales bacterium]|nr:DUF1735 domain-containing protein [Bacteroidales bacterium]
MNMKKIFKYILLSALTITAVASCTDDRNNFLPDDSFGFNNQAGNNVVTLPIYGGSYELDIIKSGKGFNEGTVNVTTSNADLLAYNKQYGLEYIPLPADQELYSFSSESIAFGKDDITKPVTVSWNIAKVAEHMAIEPANQYCIPVALRSDDLEVNDGRQVYIINLVTSTVTAEQTLISRAYEWESEPVSETANITVRIDKAIPSLDLSIDFEVDESLVATYNEANGTNYTLAPEGLVTLGATPVIKAGESYALLPVTINTDAIAEEMEVEVDGATVTKRLVKRDWDGYVVPIKLSGMSVDGVKVDNVLTYIVVKGLEPIPPQLFNRVWGIFATSSTDSWQASFGLTDCRNITMDDEYIYVPQSAGGDPVFKAISITDPTQVKNVNVEGVAGGTHTLSCARMIPNTDPAVNNGKDILSACCLSVGDGSHLHFYVWLNGIDQAPTLSMVEDSGRRLGDKYIVVGSWNNGEVYCKDYNTGNIVRYAMVDGRFGEWPGADGLAYARGRCDYSISVPDAAGCIGSAYIYPDAAGAVGGTVGGFLVSSTASAHYVANTSGNVYASSADLGLPMTHGYSFFKDDKTSLNYIAYVEVGANQDQGNVKVITDINGTPDGFMSVLYTNNVIFEAPIQDGMDATVLSPCPATHSTGDCVVREINGETYMAVMIQNVGISVFKMNAGFIAE